MKKTVSASALFLVLVGFAAPAFATSVTITYGCELFNTSPVSCTPGGPYGELKLTDSGNRVNLDFKMFPAAAGVDGLDTFYLNYDNSVAVTGSGINREFRLVDQTNSNQNSAGTINYNSNSLGPFGLTLDLSLDPSLAPGFEWHGAMLIRETTADHTESNIDVNMFLLTNPTAPFFYSAFTTLPANQARRFGATGYTVNVEEVNAVPEPASLVLIGAGLLSAAARRRMKSKP